MHDIGYWLDDHCEAVDHPKRSHDLLLTDPDKYLLGDFFHISGKPALIAEAVGWVCYGHSEERFFPLERLPYDFADQSLSSKPLNLRMLSAYLRIADEADDPYIRLVGNSTHLVRGGTLYIVLGGG
jgi:hypothetical protein